MSEQPSPGPQVETAPPPQASAPEGNNATVDAGKTTTEKVLETPKIDGQADSTDTLSDGSDMNALAEGINNGTVDVDAEFQKLAEGNGDHASGTAQNENVDGLNTNPVAENPQSSDTNSEGHDVDSQQARLDDMMNKTPEELSKLAAEGNILAKRALSDMEKQVAAGAEDLLKKQAEATSTPLSTPEAPAIPTTEQAQKDFIDQAQYKEPTADQRAQGEKVEPANESVPPAEAVKAPEITSETVDDKVEDGAEEVKTPEQEAAELRVSRDKLVAKIATEFPGIDLSSKEAQAFLDLASENKQNMSTLEAMTENFAGKQAKEAAKKMGVDVKDMAKDSINGMVTSIEQQLTELKKAIAEGDTTKQVEATKKNWLLKILKALGAVLVVAGAAVVGAGAGVGALAGSAKK